MGTHGFQKKDKKKYFNSTHYDLVKAITPLRRAFRKAKNDSVEARQQIAKEELKHWLKYLENKKKMLSF